MSNKSLDELRDELAIGYANKHGIAIAKKAIADAAKLLEELK